MSKSMRCFVTMMLLSPSLATAQFALDLAYTDQFALEWTSVDTGGDFDAAFFRPIVPEGYHALGHLGIQHHYNDTTAPPPATMLVAKELEPGALAHPVDYVLIWRDDGTGGAWDGSFWKPVAPPGYVALGSLAQFGYAKPDTTEIMCVREDLVVPGAEPWAPLNFQNTFIWNDAGTNGTFGYVSIWGIEPDPEIGDGGSCGLSVGAFLAVPQHVHPDDPVNYPVDEDYYCILSSVVSPFDASDIDIADLLLTYGPVFAFHPGELYFPDDVAAVLDDTATTLRAALVQNASDYDQFNYLLLEERPVTASTLQQVTDQLLSDLADHANNSDFKIHVQLDDSSRPGDLMNAKAYVRIKPKDQMFLEVQFWLFYPFNGPGKIRIRVGDLFDEILVMEEPGRHYGDWEQVSLRFGRDPFNGNALTLVNVYMSRHSFEGVVRADDPLLEYSLSRPIIRVARDSHAHYPTIGYQYYQRVRHQDLGIATLDADLTDFTAGGGQVLPAGDPGRYEIVSSEWPQFLPTEPAWLDFERRWGQYLRNIYSVEIDYVFDVYTYEMKEVGAGPTGPSQKKEWNSCVSADFHPGLASVLAGPFVNEATSTTYFVLRNSTYTHAEWAARQLGGFLADIHSDEETQWIVDNVMIPAGVDRSWIGLTDVESEGTFVWSSGAPLTYENWYDNEPNGGTDQNYVGMVDSGEWFDAQNDFNFVVTPVYGIVEVGSAAVLAGPIASSVTGSSYYLLDDATWLQANSTALSLGGTLVVLDDAAEQAWIQETLLQGRNVRRMWLGLTDVASEGTFVWVDGSPLTWSNWYPMEPNGGIAQPYVATDPDGLWFDAPSDWNEIVGLPVHGVVEVDQITGVEDPDLDLPAAVFSLDQNAPNPFNPRTRIAFNLPRSASVKMGIYDLKGRLVRTLLGGEVKSAGRHDVLWEGRDEGGRAVSSGLYFYRLEAGDFVETRRMTLLK